MTEPFEQPPRAETDRTISELNRGQAERVVLGKNPYGSVIRIILAVALFVLIFGSIFYFLQR